MINSHSNDFHIESTKRRKIDEPLLKEKEDFMSKLPKLKNSLYNNYNAITQKLLFKVTSQSSAKIFNNVISPTI